MSSVTWSQKDKGMASSWEWGVTRLLLLGPFYTIQTNFMYFFAHDYTFYNCSYNAWKVLSKNL